MRLLHKHYYWKPSKLFTEVRDMIKFLVINDNYDYIVQKELFWSRVGVQEMVAGGQGIGCYMMSKECESLGRSHK